MACFASFMLDWQILSGPDNARLELSISATGVDLDLGSKSHTHTPAHTHNNKDLGILSIRFCKEAWMCIYKYRATGSLMYKYIHIYTYIHIILDM